MAAVTHGQVRLSPYPDGAAEMAPADSRLLFQDAQLLLKGKAGFAALVREAESKDPAHSQAARITLLGSTDPAALPILLDRIGRVTLDGYVAIKAIRVHPEAAWPILVRMAEGRNTGALQGINLYVDRAPAEFERLSNNAWATVRAGAIGYISEPKRLEAALSDPSVEVRRAAVRRVISAVPQDEAKYLRDPRAEIRALFAELTSSRWSTRDFPIWVKLANDPSPEVRRWAMLMLAPIGLEWGNGPWTSSAIAAVNRGIHDPDPRIRENAVLAARSWLLEWPKIGNRWTHGQIEAARRVFRTSTFREAAYRAIPWEYGDENARIRMHIQVAPAYLALAISGDPRTFALFKARILKEPFARANWIQALRYVPGRPTEDLLYALIDHAMHPAAVASNQSNDFESGQILGSSLIALHGIGAHPYSRLSRYLADRSIQPVWRMALVGAMVPVADAKLLASIGSFLADTSLPVWVRMQVVYDLVYCPAPGTKALMDKVAEQDPSPEVRKAATLAAQQRAARERALGPIGMFTSNRLADSVDQWQHRAFE